METDSIQSILKWIEINRVLVYAILFGYCALKSGALPFFAGLVASSGAIDFVSAVATSFLGGYLGDEARFFIARRYGNTVLHARPRIKNAISKAVELLERYGGVYIFIYRYPKGMRTIGALPVGLSSMGWRKFTLLNAASAAVWSVILVGLGYLFGEQLKSLVAENWTAASLIMLLFFIIVAGFAYWKISSKTKTKLDTSYKRPRPSL